MSPSPEADLLTHELDHEMLMSSSSSIPDTYISSRSRSRQMDTPPPEGMEKEFTQMVSTLYERQMNEELERSSVNDARVTAKYDDFNSNFSATSNNIAMNLNGKTEAANREAAYALFGVFADSHLGLHHAQLSVPPIRGSPILCATDSRAVASAAAAHDFVDLLAWHNPDTVELDELDGLFEAY